MKAPKPLDIAIFSLASAPSLPRGSRTITRAASAGGCAFTRKAASATKCRRITARQQSPGLVLGERRRPAPATCFGFASEMGTGYATLWNTFKRITTGCSHTEKLALYSGTAVACGFTPRSVRGVAAGAEPEVRIHLPPAESRVHSTDVGMYAVPQSSPSPWLACGSPTENSAPGTATG